MVRAWSVFSRPIVDGEEQPMRDPSRIRVPGPLEPYAEGFRGELAGRGYSPGAAAVQLRLMAHLSGWLAGRGLDTAGLTSALVDAYLAERRRLGCASHWTRRALAPLLGFLRRREVVPAEATPGPAGLVGLGLRASEAAALRLDDIDWRGGAVAVHGKGNRHDRLPLPADVGQAIVAWLTAGRPDTTAAGREVFLRVRAPRQALTRGAVTQVVARAGQRAGLGPIHAHRLRHTAATRMLRGGGSLGEIGQVLRHRHALTTAIYAKVDIDALRLLARPWPAGAR